MSILTKICIVLLLVVSLLAVPAFVTMATVPPNYRVLYEREQKRNTLLSQTARHKAMALEYANLRLEDLKKEAATAGTAVRRAKQEHAAELAAEKSRVADLQNELKGFRANYEALRNNYEKNQQFTQNLQDRLDDARGRIDKFMLENSRVSDLLKQAQANVVRLEKIERVLREQIAQRDREIAQLQETIDDLETRLARGGTGTGSDVTTTSDMDTPNVEGTVIAVQNDLAGINIGSAQGIKQGMRLIVYRGDQFVSYLQVVDVDPNQAGGVIVDKRLDPMQGDRVTSSVK